MKQNNLCLYHRQAGLVGFEPTIHGSKPWVLPFDDSPSNLYLVVKIMKFVAEPLENLTFESQICTIISYSVLLYVSNTSFV